MLPDGNVLAEVKEGPCTQVFHFSEGTRDRLFPQEPQDVEATNVTPWLPNIAVRETCYEVLKPNLQRNFETNLSVN